jgi:type I restriction enzyme R subunit
MSGINAPERVAQKRVIRQLRELGYDYLGDWQYRENNQNIEEKYLRYYLEEKAGYREALISRAIRALRVAASDKSHSLYQVNKAVYGLLRYGAQVRTEQGGKKERVALIDWANPRNNHFGVAEEVTVQANNPKRPDLVLYVNGIALGVIELKRSSVSIEKGIRQNIANQESIFIEPFFTTMQLVMAGNNTQGLRYGTIRTQEKYYQKWKEETAQEYDYILDRHIAQLLNPERFLEIIKDFVLFDGGVKKVCRPHQYFGVKAAQERLLGREGGIIWHTQGSGKSLTMVWLAQWIKENITDARVLVITDRDELDKQIVRVFNEVGEDMKRAKSGRHLLERLNKSEDTLLCSLVHKFGNRQRKKGYDDYIAELRERLPKDFRPKGNIYVFVDECHRTQSGKLHDAMKEILPEATFIGFTGTPLLKKDKQKSIEIFGTYIHTYKFDEAVADGTVLDLRYEARDVDQYITDQQSIDDWFDAETRGMTDYARDKLKQRWGTLQAVLSSKSRLEKIAYDVLKDFRTKPRLSTGEGNAMLVSGSIYEACKYYEIFQSLGFKKCAIVTSYNPLEAGIKDEFTGAGQTEKLLQYEIYKKMLHGKSPEDFEDEAKDLFVKEPATMQLLIVVDKLLTGFDAPSATYLYIDKKMRDHGLFQAICRVNRLDDESKEYGYIVDYKDLFKSLQKSINDYTSEAFEHFDEEDVAGLLKDRLDNDRERLENAREQIKALCEPVFPKNEPNFIKFFCGDTADEEALKKTEEKRQALYKYTVGLIRAYANLANELTKAGYTEQEQQAIKRDVEYYAALRDVIMQASGEYLDLKKHEPAMRQLMDMYIEARPSQKLSALEDFSLLELILRKNIKEAIEELPESIRKHEEAVAEVIEGNIRRLLTQEKQSNPVLYERMSRLLTEVIEQRRQQVIDYAEYLKKIEAIARETLAPETGNQYPKAINTKGRRSLYDNLGADEALAILLDEKIKYGKKANWRGHFVKEKEVENMIKEVVKDEEKVKAIYKIIFDMEGEY